MGAYIPVKPVEERILPPSTDDAFPHVQAASSNSINVVRLTSEKQAFERSATNMFPFLFIRISIHMTTEQFFPLCLNPNNLSPEMIVVFLYHVHMLRLLFRIDL